MTKEYIDVQRLAADPAYSVYINASAGSGKTKVLVDRILRLILSGSKLSSILCLTFTKAAAEEMIERLKARAKFWCLSSDLELENDLKNLEGQLSKEHMHIARSLYDEMILESDKVNIQTLHAFCAKVLRIDIDGSTGAREKIISTATKHELLKRAFYRSLNDDDLQHDVQALSLFFSSNTIFDYITQLISQRNKLYHYMCNIIDDDLKGKVFNVFGLNSNFSIDNYLSAEIKKIDWTKLSSIASCLQGGGYKKAETIMTWLNASVEARCESILEYADIFLTHDFQIRKRLEGIKTLSADAAKALLDHQMVVYNIIEMKRTYEAAECNLSFLKFTRRVFDRYEQMKKKKGLLDYDQLLFNTIDMLKNAENRHGVLWQLDCAIDHVLVDEAQDLNSMQWEIIHLLTDEFFAGIGAKDLNRTIFIVGDQKQSIFGFQGAEPEIFVKVAEHYRKKSQQALKKWIEIDFLTSFRSGVEILSVVDDTFASTQLTAAFDITYQNHISYRNSKSIVDIWIYEEQQKVTAQEEGIWLIPDENAKKIDAESVSSMIVGKIKEWIESKRNVSGHARTLELADIMIIFRKRGRIYNELCAELRKNNLPFNTNAPISLKDSSITLGLIALLRFIIKNDDDFHLVILLKSHIFNCTEKEVFDIAFGRKRQTIFSVLKNSANHRHIYDKLERLIKECKSKTLYAFFYNVCFESRSVNSEKADFKADQIKFLETLIKFEKERPFAGPHEFLRWFHGDKPESSVQDIAGDAIVITTAHSAKGLEAKIVILADAFESENLSHDNIFWIGDDIILSAGSKYDNALIQRIKAQYKDAQKQESLRLLYVAMTRARDELYVVGRLKDRKNDNWCQLISSRRGGIEGIAHH